MEAESSLERPALVTEVDTSSAVGELATAQAFWEDDVEPSWFCCTD